MTSSDEASVQCSLQVGSSLQLPGDTARVIASVAYLPHGGAMLVGTRCGVLIGLQCRSVVCLHEPTGGEEKPCSEPWDVVFARRLHEGPVYDVVVSGVQVATAGHDALCCVTTWGQLCEAAGRGGAPRIVAGHSMPVVKVCFTGSGAFLASLSIDGDFRVFDLRGNGEASAVQTFRAPFIARTFSFSPDEVTAIIGGEGLCRVDLRALRAGADEVREVGVVAGSEWKRCTSAWEGEGEVPFVRAMRWATIPAAPTAVGSSAGAVEVLGCEGLGWGLTIELAVFTAPTSTPAERVIGEVLLPQPDELLLKTAASLPVWALRPPSATAVPKVLTLFNRASTSHAKEALVLPHALRALHLPRYLASACVASPSCVNPDRCRVLEEVTCRSALLRAILGKRGRQRPFEVKTRLELEKQRLEAEGGRLMKRIKEAQQNNNNNNK